MHLSAVKYTHWDEPIRLLAAQSAARLAPLDSEWAVTEMLPRLIGRTLSLDLKERHGATHMVAEVLLGLTTELHGGDGAKLPLELRKAVAGAVPAIEKARLYRGRGGETLRTATARLLEVQATLRMPRGPKASLAALASIDETLKHPVEPISLSAVAALRAIAASYFSSAPAAGAPLEPLVSRYAEPLRSDPNAALRRGYSLALGALPQPQLRAALPAAVGALIGASKMEENVELRDPETRRNALRALLQVAATAGLVAFEPRATADDEPAPPPPPADEKPAEGGDAAPAATAPAAGMSAAVYIECVEAMLSALGDYQTDNRGDVGSWVREAAIVSLLPMLRLACPPDDVGSLDDSAEVAAERAALSAALPSLCLRFARGLAQQANEKIDRMRDVAATTLTSLLECDALPGVAHRAELAEVFCSAAEAEAAESAPAPTTAPSLGAAAAVDVVAAAAGVTDAEAARRVLYISPYSCYPRTAALLSWAAYRRDTLAGLAISVGGITESTTKAASAALLKRVGMLAPAERAPLADDLVSLLDEHAATPRVSLPLMRTLEVLLESRLLEPLLAPAAAPAAGEAAPLAAALLRAVKPAAKSKDVPTLLVATSLMILMLPHAAGVSRTETLRSVVLLLAHRFPKVRKAAADALYVHLITYGDVGALAPMVVEGGGEAAAPAEPPMAEGPERHEAVLSVLTETAWLGGLDEAARPARARLLGVLGLPPPMVAAKAAVAKKAEADSYAELVGEMGY